MFACCEKPSMKNIIHTAKSSELGNFEILLRELVQREVNSALSEISTVKNQMDRLSVSNEILTIKGVAKVLELNERVVREKINHGLIPAYKPPFSNKFYVIKDELLKTILQCERRNTLDELKERVHSDFANCKNIFA